MGTIVRLHSFFSYFKYLHVLFQSTKYKSFRKFLIWENVVVFVVNYLKLEMYTGMYPVYLPRDFKLNVKKRFISWIIS